MRVSKASVYFGVAASIFTAAQAHPDQVSFNGPTEGGHDSIASVAPEASYWVPRIDRSAYLDLDNANSGPGDGGDENSLPEMSLHALRISGPSSSRVDLTFFSDGYTTDEEDKFVADAEKLTREIVSDGGAMSHVSGLLNVWGVFVPSETSGIGTHDTPLPGAAFGLYRPGPELRGVYITHHKRARRACAYWRSNTTEGGCDSAILLGNDPLYGGLGGEFTVITASEKNGPLVLRHELGHTLIPVGEEYEGGVYYFGVNADKPEHLDSLSWRDYLTDKDLRVEDAKVPLQVYPWRNLTSSDYSVNFTSSNPVHNHTSDITQKTGEKAYPTAMMRLSLSSIPFTDHISIKLNELEVDLSPGFPPSWAGSLDRRWVDVPLPRGVESGENRVTVSLTRKGRKAVEGQGGKMITSLEVIEYGGDGRFNHTKGHIGAYPTYDINGKMSLRPTNEQCLMRNVVMPTFCPVCADGLKKSLESMIAKKQE